MLTDVQVLLLTAIVVAGLHTVTGPDHYIPFIALAKSNRWSFKKMLVWTIVCGMGHILSSVILSLLLTGAGWSVARIANLEDWQGVSAGWLLLGFGIAYGAWGLYRTMINRRHKHFDVHSDGSVYVYRHNHGDMVLPANRYRVTPWVMFIIFVLGPCEPMVPLLAFPAAKNSWGVLLLLILVYSFFTLIAMSLMVTLGYFGVSFLKNEKLEQYAHPLAGVSIFLCGAGMVFFGL